MDQIFLKCKFTDDGNGNKVWQCTQATSELQSDIKNVKIESIKDISKIDAKDIDPVDEVKEINTNNNVKIPFIDGEYEIDYIFETDSVSKDFIESVSLYMSSSNMINQVVVVNGIMYMYFDGNNLAFKYNESERTYYLDSTYEYDFSDEKIKNKKIDKNDIDINFRFKNIANYIFDLQSADWDDNNWESHAQGTVIKFTPVINLNNNVNKLNKKYKLYDLSLNNELWTVKGQSLMKEFDLNINPEEKIKDSDIDYMLENNKLLEYLKITVPWFDYSSDNDSTNLKAILLNMDCLTYIDETWTEDGVDFVNTFIKNLSKNTSTIDNLPPNLKPVVGEKVTEDFYNLSFDNSESENKYFELVYSDPNVIEEKKNNLEKITKYNFGKYCLFSDCAKYSLSKNYIKNKNNSHELTLSIENDVNDQKSLFIKSSINNNIKMKFNLENKEEINDIFRNQYSNLDFQNLYINHNIVTLGELDNNFDYKSKYYYITY